MLFSVKLTNAHTVCGRPTLKNSRECFRNGLFRELKGKQRKLSRHSMTSKSYGPHRRNEKSKYQECTCKIDKSFNREIFKMFVSSKICKGGYQSGNSDCDFCNGEHNKFPVSVAGCQQLKPQRTESYENCVVEEIKPGFHMIVRIVPIAPVVSKYFETIRTTGAIGSFHMIVSIVSKARDAGSSAMSLG